MLVEWIAGLRGTTAATADYHLIFAVAALFCMVAALRPSFIASFEETTLNGRSRQHSFSRLSRGLEKFGESELSQS